MSEVKRHGQSILPVSATHILFFDIGLSHSGRIVYWPPRDRLSLVNGTRNQNDVFVFVLPPDRDCP